MADVRINYIGDATSVVDASRKAQAANAKVEKSVADLAREIHAAEQALRAQAKAQGVSTAALKKAQREFAATNATTQQLAKSTAGLGDQAVRSARKLDGLQDQAGEVDSVMQGLASALDMVDPRLGDLTRSAGDAAGGLEALARGSSGLGAVAVPAALALATIGTTAVVVANQMDEARDATRLYREELEDTIASQRNLTASSIALKAGTGEVASVVGDLSIQTGLLTGEIDQADVVAGELGSALADSLEPSLEAAGRAVGENANRIQKLEGALRSGKLSTEDYLAAQEQLAEAKGIQPELEANLEALKAEYTEGREAIDAYTTALRDSVTAGEDSIETGKARVGVIVAETGAILAFVEAQERYAASIAKSKEPAQEELELLAQRNALFTEGLNVQRQEAEQRESAHAAELARIAEQQAAYESAQATVVDTATATATALIDLGHAVTAAKMDGLDTETEAGKEAAKKLFKINKALNFVQVQLDAGSAAMKSLAVLGPPVPPNVPGIAGMAAVSTQHLLSSAMVLAQKPPEFARGGIIPPPRTSPDHMMVAAAPGEGIVNRSAMQHLGEDGLSDLNAGRGMGPSVVVIQGHDHMVFDAFVAENLAKGGPLQRAVTRASRPGHSRRARR